MCSISGRSSPFDFTRKDGRTDGQPPPSCLTVGEGKLDDSKVDDETLRVFQPSGKKKKKREKSFGATLISGAPAALAGRKQNNGGESRGGTRDRRPPPASNRGRKERGGGLKASL